MATKKQATDPAVEQPVSDESREAAQTQAIEETIKAVAQLNSALTEVSTQVERHAAIDSSIFKALVSGLASVNERLDKALKTAQERAEYARAEIEHLKTGKPLEITEAMLDQLKAPLPPEAVTPNPDNPVLSTIKTIFVIERLNEVFGVAGWNYKAEVIEGNPTHEQIVVRVVIEIPKYGIRHEAFGGNAMKDRGDAYKGAVTDAISKIGSMLYIGMDIYKGFGPTSRNGGRRTPPRSTVTTAATSAATPAGAVETIPLCADCNTEIQTITVGGDSYTPAQLVANSRKVWRSKPGVSDSTHDGPALCGNCQRSRRKVAQTAAAAAPPTPTVAAPVNGTAGPIR